jgi:hypothetical protein
MVDYKAIFETLYLDEELNGPHPYQYLLQIKQLTWLQVHRRLENSLFQNLLGQPLSFDRPLACIALPQHLKKNEVI